MGALPLLNCQRAFRLGRERTAPAASTCFMLATTVMRAKQRVRTAAHVLVAFALASSAPLRGMSYARSVKDPSAQFLSPARAHSMQNLLCATRCSRLSSPHHMFAAGL